MQKGKLPHPDKFRAELAAGRTMEWFLSEYGVKHRSSIHYYMQKHGIEGPVPYDPARYVRPALEEDERKVIIRIVDLVGPSRSSSELSSVLISLPRVTFIHGEYRP